MTDSTALMPEPGSSPGLPPTEAPARRSGCFAGCLRILLWLVGLVFVTWLLWIWFVGDWFFPPAPPLDELLPRDVEAAVRLEGVGIARRDGGRGFWTHPGTVRTREEFGLGSELDSQMAEALAAFEEATGGLLTADSLAETLFGEDVVVAVREEDYLLLTRAEEIRWVMPLARQVASADGPLHDEGTALRVDLGGGTSMWIASDRDTLMAATDADLLTAAIRCADGFGQNLAGNPAYEGALACGEDAGGVIRAWFSRPFLDEWLDAVPENILTDTLLEMVPPDDVRGLRLAVDLGRTDALELRWETPYERNLPDLVRDLSADGAPPGGRMRARASRFAPPAEALVLGGISTDTGPFLTRVLGQASGWLGESGTGNAGSARQVERAAQALARQLEDGAGLVMVRLREADGLALDHPDEGEVRAMPGFVVAIPLREGADAGRLGDEIETQAARALGEGTEVVASDVVTGEAGSARIVEFRSPSLHHEWQLVRPAYAIAERHLLLSSNAALLARALEPREPQPYGDDAPEFLDLTIDAATLRKHMHDQRWAYADETTQHDWRVEAAKIVSSKLRRGERLTPAQRRARMREEVSRLMSRRNLEEFPAAIEAHGRRWAWLEAVGGGRLRLSVDELRMKGILRIELAPR